MSEQGKAREFEEAMIKHFGQMTDAQKIVGRWAYETLQARVQELERMNQNQRVYFDENVQLKEKIQSLEARLKRYQEIGDMMFRSFGTCDTRKTNEAKKAYQNFIREDEKLQGDKP